MLSADGAWDLLLALVKAADDTQLVMVAADAFNTLVGEQISVITDRVIGEAKRNPRFREMMRHSMFAWSGYVPPEVLAEIKR